MVRCNKGYIIVGARHPNTAAPPPSAAADGDDHYISITVSYTLTLHPIRIDTPRQFDPPQLRDRMTFPVPLRCFLADAEASFRSIIADMDLILPEGSVEGIALRALSASQKYMAKTRRTSTSTSTSTATTRVLYRVKVDITGVQLVWSLDEVESMGERKAARLSERAAVGPVAAAAKASVEVLDVVVMSEERGGGDGQERCTICLDKFDARVSDMDDHDDRDKGRDRRVVKMPCSHLYHKDCIVQWLEENHKCPLCRYAMPTN